MTQTILNVKPWCTCHASGAWRSQDGYTLDPPSGLWVHSRCRKPSKMNYDRLVLGIVQIPQYRKEEDIYDIEQRYWADQIIQAEILELGWDDTLADEEDKELSSWIWE